MRSRSTRKSPSIKNTNPGVPSGHSQSDGRSLTRSPAHHRDQRGRALRARWDIPAGQSELHRRQARSNVSASDRGVASTAGRTVAQQVRHRSWTRRRASSRRCARGRRWDGELKARRDVCGGAERAHTMLRTVVFTLTIGLTAGIALAVEDLYVYPTKNQSAEQIGRDKQECHDWAVKQTGVDPVKMASEPASSA